MSDKRSKWLKAEAPPSNDRGKDKRDASQKRPKERLERVTMASKADKHQVYAEAVQLPREEAKNLYRIAFRLGARHGAPPRVLREDFAGTGVLCLAWTRQNVLNTAYGVDLDRETVNYSLKHVLAGQHEADRVKMVVGNVLADRERELRIPKADIIAALNYGCCYFYERRQLLEYLKKSLDSLKSRGVLVADLFGARSFRHEKRSEKHPNFTYVFEQSEINPITNRINLDLHFAFPDGSWLRRAFSYDFRVWTIRDLREAMLEVGFEKVAMFVGDTSKRKYFKEDGEEEEEQEGGGKDSAAEDDDEPADYIQVKTGDEMAGMQSWNGRLERRERLPNSDFFLSKLTSLA